MSDQEHQQHRDSLPQPHTLLQAEKHHEGPITTSYSKKNDIACLNCRASRQKCDRKRPCSRCVAQGNRPCRYPLNSNRGRKQGVANKPPTVEKFLSRINESPLRDQIIEALLESHRPERDTTSSFPNLSGVLAGDGCTTDYDIDTGIDDGCQRLPARTTSLTKEVTAQREKENLPTLPSDITSGEEVFETSPSVLETLSHRVTNWSLTNHLGASVPTHGRLAEYFAPQSAYETDWQVLAYQPTSSPLRLETATCDPIKARLIDQEDASRYFKQFFKTRNPLVGLLDPILHTPEYVSSTSFTLFSVVCALGCAVSACPRDRVLYPTLLSLAESNVRWSIALSVKTLETIQAIVNLQYWAPANRRQSMDPYWLHLSHAVQLARDIGIHRGLTIAEQVNMVAPNADADSKERLTRNFERTWLYMFIAEKSFGIITGRSPCVSWKEIPLSVAEWWRRPMTCTTDRLISGIVEIRCHLLNALEQKKSIDKTLSSILNWHAQSSGVLCGVRNTRCDIRQGVPAATSSLLAFYMDHTILILYTQTLRELILIGSAAPDTEIWKISRQIVHTAVRLLDLVLTDQFLCDLMYGFHNNQFIMICHAVTETIQAIKRGNLVAADISHAASRVRGIRAHMEKISEGLPETSAAHIYSELCHFFVIQLDNSSTPDNGRSGCASAGPDDLFADWWKAVEVGSLDTTSWFDMSFLPYDVDRNVDSRSTDWEFS